jgi:adenylylsulfate kinase
MKMAPVIWISGTSASGKTTMGLMLKNSLCKLKYDTTFLDGDLLRKQLPKKYGHSIKDRYEILNEYIKIIKKEASIRTVVIVATISHKKDMRLKARKLLDNIFEINLRCSTSECAKRDYKKQYVRAISGDFACFPGITEEYEFSDSAELILDTEKNNISQSFDILYENIKKYLKTFNNN